MELASREQEILRILTLLEGRTGFVVVGGYALNAYTQPRFSVDLDIVVGQKNAARFRTLLEKEGYKKTKTFTELPYGGRFERFEKKVGGLAVWVDLLVGEIAVRQTGKSYPFAYVRKNSATKEIVCRSGKAKTTVATPEMLAALKLNSARKTDIRDLFMLCGMKLDTAKVTKHLEGVLSETLATNLETVQNALKDKKFKDALQGVYGLVNEKQFEKCRKRLMKLMELLA